ADAEICMMLADVLEAVGIARNDYQIRLNSRKILNGVLDSLGLLDAEVRGGVLRTIDKFDKIGEAGVRSLLTKGRLDKSGAFIDGVGLSPDQADGVLAFLMAKGKKTDDTLNNLADIVGDSAEGAEGIVELRSILDLVRGQGYECDRIVLDPSVVRGLGYYTGAVYEAELTFEIKDKKGRVRQFGSVAGGGRYDDLIKRFTGQSIPATGVSVGVDRLLAALEERGGKDADKDTGKNVVKDAEYHESVADSPVVVTVMDKDDHRIKDYQKMVAELRNKGVRAELYLGNPKHFSKQLKYADMRGSPLAIIQGSDEFDRGKVQIKNLALGAQLSKNIDSLEEWRKQPAQITIDREHLAVRVERFITTGDLRKKSDINKDTP
nr:histidine--tRNA ligase family protein [Pseudomonadota bacterium]